MLTALTIEAKHTGFAGSVRLCAFFLYAHPTSVVTIVTIETVLATRADARLDLTRTVTVCFTEFRARQAEVPVVARYTLAVFPVAAPHAVPYTLLPAVDTIVTINTAVATFSCVLFTHCRLAVCWTCVLAHFTEIPNLTTTFTLSCKQREVKIKVNLNLTITC